MWLLDLAKALFASGWTIDEVRRELRCQESFFGDYPTCDYVEEVLVAAMQSQ
jgi:hypothetical protein